ncbi:MAG: tRNA (guanosine(46)-N7)-methyltransferase TrmB [Pseudomonadota bacterium]
MPDPRHHRPIRSYVLRQGRLTTGQRRAFATLWSRFGIDFTPGTPLDPQHLFGNRRPVWLEIGFGNGDSLASLAEHHPEINFLGIEVHRPGAGHLLLRIEELGLANLRVLSHDAVEVVEALPEASLDRIMLFFPDPWHKKKHHKRRILQPDFVDQLSRVIGPGGVFHAATDWEDYAHHMMAVLSQSTRFVNTCGSRQYAPRPEERPLTRFEQRGHRLGHGVWDLVFERCPDNSTWDSPG